MSCPVEYWIWLQRALGAGKKISDYLLYYGDPRNIYEAGREKLLKTGIIDRKIIDALAEYSPSQSYSIMKQCEDNGWKIIAYDNEYYPPLLRKINDSPLVLYVQGDETVLAKQFSMGIVGTRKASGYGIKVAKDISKILVQAGSVIVSGGALGIDSASHEAAIEAGGKTVAILGGGLGNSYLSQNEPLRQRIAENGALVSEYFPFEEPTVKSFPIRNRLISGMCRGTIVVEAKIKSGSIGTANHAKKQGRPVFAVPGEMFDLNFEGTNYLINNGALPLFNVADIVNYYKDMIMSENDGEMPEIEYSVPSEKERPVKSESEKREIREIKEKPQVEKKKQHQKVQLPETATENAVKLYGIITEIAKTADEYVEETGMSVQDMFAAITELEIYGVVTMYSGNRYGLKIN